MEPKQDLIRITAEYLQDKIDYEKLLAASGAYKELLYTLCGEELNNSDGRDDIHFENGKALGAFWAALCLDDLMRTRQFIRGIHKAFNDKLEEQDSLNVLYAGTGPFATLLLPVLLHHLGKDITYTFLEINEISLRLVKKVISALKLDQLQIAFVQADASVHQLGPSKPDIIISETMQNALFKEQQVSIFYNLMEQAKPETVFIPEDISLSIGLKQGGIPIEKLGQANYKKVEKVLEINKDCMVSQKDLKGQPVFPGKTVTLNSESMKGFKEVVLITEIQVYKDELIRLKESGLTMPQHMADTPQDDQYELSINTQYIISDEPKLDYDIKLIKNLTV